MLELCCGDPEMDMDANPDVLINNFCRTNPPQHPLDLHEYTGRLLVIKYCRYPKSLGLDWLHLHAFPLALLSFHPAIRLLHIR